MTQWKDGRNSDCIEARIVIAEKKQHPYLSEIFRRPFQK